MKQKSVLVAYFLFLFLGFIGAHKFYLGKVGIGILYILTGGFFLVGVFIDLFTLGQQVRKFNSEEAALFMAKGK